LQEAEQLTKIETRGRQQGVMAISGAALQPVAAQQSIVFRMPDYRFDHCAAFEPTFDFIRDTSLLSGDVDRCVRMTNGPVPLYPWSTATRNGLRPTISRTSSSACFRV